MDTGSTEDTDKALRLDSKVKDAGFCALIHQEVDAASQEVPMGFLATVRVYRDDVDFAVVKGLPAALKRQDLDVVLRVADLFKQLVVVVK